MKDFIGDYIEVTILIIVCMTLVIFTLVSINKSYKKAFYPVKLKKQ